MLTEQHTKICFCFLGVVCAQEVDLDTTASEANSSLAEDGVYPLPATPSEYDSQNGDEDADYHGNNHRMQEEIVGGRSMDDHHQTDEFTSDEVNMYLPFYVIRLKYKGVGLFSSTYSEIWVDKVVEITG